MISDNPNSVSVFFDTNGRVQFIYHDELSPLLSLGESSIRRASHVEPDDRGLWFADLSLSGGPVLGPFGLRQMALAAEVEWLEARSLR